MKKGVYACLAIFILSGCASSLTFKSVDLIKGEYSNQNVPGSLSAPKGNGPFPVVMLLHTAGGVLPHVSEDWPSYLNSIGYATLTIDTAGIRGGRRMDWSRDHQIEDAYGALDKLASVENIDVSRAALMGFSAGGMAIGEAFGLKWKSPAGRNFRAAISVYPNCSFIQWDNPNTLYPLAVIVPEKDTLMNSDCFGRKQPNVEVHVIKNAHHGFDHSHFSGPRSDRYGNHMEYSPAAVDEAQKITKAFLDKHLNR